MPPRGGLKRRLADLSGDEGSRGGGLPAAPAVGRGGSSAPQKGVRQRHAAEGRSAADESRSAEVDLPLTAAMKRDWGRGKLSSVKVLEYAVAAHNQGARGLQSFTRCSHAQNAQRSLVAAFGRPKGTPDFTWVSIPTARGNIVHPFLLPHEWFRCLFLEAPRTWENCVTGPDGAALEFWKSMKDTAFASAHPVLERKDWARSIPLGLHGDAGAFSKQESVYLFTWNSLLGAGSTSAKRFVFTLLKKSDVTAGTLDEIMRIFAWSMNSLLTGIVPRVNWLGLPVASTDDYIAGGWKGVFTQVRGDWQFMCELFKFPAWNGAENMCWICKASNKIPELIFTDCRLCAGWRRTMRTHESYVADVSELPVLFLKATGFRLECVMIDILHCVDLGVASHIIGNIFWELILARTWGKPNAEENTAMLYKEMQAHYKSTRETSRLQGKLKVERIRTSGGWPKLKAKAAATRHLARFALKLALDHNDGTVHNRRRLGVAQSLVDFYDIIEREDMFLSDDAKQRLPEIGRTLCFLYGHLSAEASSGAAKLWKFQPKHHLFLHLCEWQAIHFGNPRFYWCYADEDMVGHMIEVAHSCHSRTMAGVAMYKWLLFTFGEAGKLEKHIITTSINITPHSTTIT